MSVFEDEISVNPFGCLAQFFDVAHAANQQLVWVRLFDKTKTYKYLHIRLTSCKPRNRNPICIANTSIHIYTYARTHESSGRTISAWQHHICQANLDIYFYCSNVLAFIAIATTILAMHARTWTGEHVSVDPKSVAIEQCMPWRILLQTAKVYKYIMRRRHKIWWNIFESSLWLRNCFSGVNDIIHCTIDVVRNSQNFRFNRNETKDEEE